MRQILLVTILLASILCLVSSARDDTGRMVINLADSGPTLTAFRRLIRNRERARYVRIRERERSRYRRLRDRLRATALRLGIDAA